MAEFITSEKANLAKLLLHLENITFLFPDGTGDTITLTAGNPADTFGAWAEIIDNNLVTLSSKFTAKSGYLSELTLRDYSVANEIYIIEVAHGSLKTPVGRAKVRSDWTYVLSFLSLPIPKGQTVYYRMKAETGLATLVADFRYFFV